MDGEQREEETQREKERGNRNEGKRAWNKRGEGWGETKAKR